MIAAFIWIGLLAVVAAVPLVAWLDPIWHAGAPFFPTSRKWAHRLAAEFKPAPGRPLRVAELGAGAGTVVLAFAELGASVDGFEINPLLSAISNRRLRRRGLADSARVICRDFWSVDLTPYDLVYVFQVNPIMNSLAAKFRQELRPGAYVVSCSWKIKSIPLVRRLGPFSIYQIEP